ncbi:MarR family winged helix-turn-helix transcriptional regulator [Micromonospora sp. CA-240977]|uniref:MarR family winged helix-turn-helix transcriptional regulator n=1 Tax=Micromonospora sp. CA-240977 TaxID=3239957 RepID=UPI003D89B455
MESLPGELAELVRQLSKHIRRSARDRLAPLRLTPEQGRALTVLAHAGRPLRMVELAGHLQVVPRTVTDLVDQLEATGLVTRRADPDSRRSVLVAMTARGTSTIEELAAARRRAAEELFGGLGDDDQKLLRDLLRAALPTGAAAPTLRPDQPVDGA